jgi:DUF4097 and DUF4098 domain-containing protein YvlB
MLKTTNCCAGLVIALAIPPQVPAQISEGRQASSVDRCRENQSRYARYCEVRDFTIARRSSLVVVGGTNGEVVIHGSRDNMIHVVATVRAEAMTAEAAYDIARSVQIRTGDNQIKAEGPNMPGMGSWSVSYELWVPVSTDLQISSLNGSLSVDGVNGQIDLQSTNGTVSLSNVNGDVRARTSNGGVSLSLSGDRWAGAGLDAGTLNGPVQVVVSSGYSAMLHASTVVGRLTSDLGDAASRADDRTFEKRLGRGGPRLVLTTVNGPVSVHQRR